MIINKEYIINYFNSGIRNTKEFKIGIEHEKFLSLDGLYKAIGFEKRDPTYPQLTDHYFTGDYPVKPIDELGDNRVTQLSLLSSASNS